MKSKKLQANALHTDFKEHKSKETKNFAVVARKS